MYIRGFVIGQFVVLGLSQNALPVPYTNTLKDDLPALKDHQTHLTAEVPTDKSQVGDLSTQIIT